MAASAINLRHIGLNQLLGSSYIVCMLFSVTLEAFGHLNTIKNIESHYIR